jgi:hypothetical protein
MLQVGLQPDRSDQVDSLRAAGKDGLTALVYRQPVELADAELAADQRAGLQDRHPRRCRAGPEGVRRREPADAAADDDDMPIARCWIHPPTLAGLGDDFVSVVTDAVGVSVTAL